MDDKSREDFQKTLMQLEMGRRQMEQLGRQAQAVESGIMELAATVEALKAMREQKPGAEVMMPLGAGSYMRAELKDAENVLVGVGADMTVEKKLSDAVDTLEERKTKLAESLKSVQQTMGELSTKLSELNAHAEQMAQGQQQNV